jgi:hypothetical protein
MTPDPCPDDLPAAQPSSLDAILQHQLAKSVSQHFYESCTRITQILLTSCKWRLSPHANALILTITCPDAGTYWYITSHLKEIARQLAAFAGDARIRVLPPQGIGVPFEMGLDEILPNLPSSESNS